MYALDIAQTQKFCLMYQWESTVSQNKGENRPCSHVAPSRLEESRVLDDTLFGSATPVTFHSFKNSRSRRGLRRQRLPAVDFVTCLIGILL